MRVELLAAADFVEALKKSSGRTRARSGALEIMQHLAAMHHHDAVAEVHRLLHGMSDHQRGEFVAR